MKSSRRQLLGSLAFILLASLLFPAPRVAGSDQLVWQANQVAAEISSWDLHKLLENLAEASGWQIYVEPETKHVVSTKFKDRSQGEALRLLLGDLSFALLPSQTNGPARLFVFRTSLQEATQLIKVPQKRPSEKTGKPIPNELIVTLKPGVNIDELAKKLGAKVTGRADKLNTYRLQFEDAEATEKG